MLFVSLVCLGTLILLLGVVLFLRILFELTATWGPDRWHAGLRVYGRGNWFEGYGSFQEGKGTLGMKLGGVRLVERSAGAVLKSVGKIRPRDGREQRKRDPLAGMDRIPLYWGVGRRALGAFRDPALSMEGTYSFQDPSVTGQVAGVIYSVRAVLQEVFPCSRLDLHPDFEGVPAKGGTRISFSLRMFRLLHPGLWYLRQVRAGRRDDKTEKKSGKGMKHG
jgi:hypothetical protein